MTLIYFTEPNAGSCEGISSGHVVAQIDYHDGEWIIMSCPGFPGQSPLFKDLFLAQQTCNAYMAKFLLDIGFVPGNHTVTK